jgi:hypothetical protein
MALHRLVPMQLFEIWTPLTKLLLTMAVLISLYGLSNISSTIGFHSNAFLLKLAPGNHAGRYFTV